MTTKKKQEQEPELTELEQEQEQVLEQAETAEAPDLLELAGLLTIETGNQQQIIGKLKLADDDKELVYAALDVLAEVINRKITNESTRSYLGLLLVFIRSALSV